MEEKKERNRTMGKERGHPKEEKGGRRRKGGKRPSSQGKAALPFHYRPRKQAVAATIKKGMQEIGGRGRTLSFVP